MFEDKTIRSFASPVHQVLLDLYHWFHPLLVYFTHAYRSIGYFFGKHLVQTCSNRISSGGFLFISTTLFFPYICNFGFWIPHVGVDTLLLFCKFLFLAFSFIWTLGLVEYPFMLLRHYGCPMRLLTISPHFARSRMACGSGSRTNWIAIRALQCSLRHLAHGVALLASNMDKLEQSLGCHIGNSCFWVLWVLRVLRVLRVALIFVFFSLSLRICPQDFIPSDRTIFLVDPNPTTRGHPGIL